MKRPTLYLVPLLLAAALSPGLLAQNLKLGVFDSQRISEVTHVGKQMQAELSAFQTKKESEISEKEKEIQGLQEKLSKQELSIASDVRIELEKNIQRQMLFLQSVKETATREMQLELAAAKSSFEDKLILAVEAFGRDEGFSMIVDRSVVAWADKSVDVTTAIVDRFNQMFPADSK